MGCLFCWGLVKDVLAASSTDLYSRTGARRQKKGMLAFDTSICLRGGMIQDFIELAEGNKLFTSGAVCITKLELADRVREKPDKKNVEPNIWGVYHVMLDCLLIIAITHVIELEMP